MLIHGGAAEARRSRGADAQNSDAGTDISCIAATPETPATCRAARSLPLFACRLVELHEGDLDDGVWTAWRKDGRGSMLADPLPEGLRLRILADYAAMPVPRNLP